MRQSFCLLIVVIFLSLVGCAKPPQERVLWPPPPNDPKLEWLNVYYSEENFPKGAGAAAFQSLVGEGSDFPFMKPVGIVSDGKGKVYVSDTLLKEVKVYDMTLRQVSSLARKNVFKKPLGMALDSEGRIYVVDGGSSQVLVFSADHKPLFSFGEPELLKMPAFIVVHDGLDRIYVSDAHGHRIVVFDRQGKHLFSFGQHGPGDGQFYSPQGLAFDQDNRLFVADQYNFRIQVFDAEGKFLDKFGELGDQLWQFEMPKDLAFDSEGNLYVVDARKAAFLIYRKDGRLLLNVGMGRTGHAMGFLLPAGISIDSRDRVYVTDQLLKRYTEWQYLSQAYLEANPISEAELERQRDKMERVRESQK